MYVKLKSKTYHSWKYDYPYHSESSNNLRIFEQFTGNRIVTWYAKNSYHLRFCSIFCYLPHFFVSWILFDNHITKAINWRNYYKRNMKIWQFLSHELAKTYGFSKGIFFFSFHCLYCILPLVLVAWILGFKWNHKMLNSTGDWIPLEI